MPSIVLGHIFFSPRCPIPFVQLHILHHFHHQGPNIYRWNIYILPKKNVLDSHCFTLLETNSRQKPLKIERPKGGYIKFGGGYRCNSHPSVGHQPSPPTPWNPSLSSDRADSGFTSTYTSAESWDLRPRNGRSERGDVEVGMEMICIYIDSVCIYIYRDR